jgi:hypothetical protein
MLTGVWTSVFELWYFPYGLTRPDENPRRPDGCNNLPISVFWKEILKLNWTLRVVWTGCWIVRTDASWSSLKLLDTKEGPIGNPRRPDGWCFSLMYVRTVWHVVRMAGDLDSWTSGRNDTSSGRLARNLNFWLANCAESFGNTSK